MPLWLKPTYIAIALLVVLLGVQTWRLSAAHLAAAQAETAQAQLVADVATARADGMLEGKRQQEAAQALQNAKHVDIVAGLLNDKLRLQQSYNNTYDQLKEFAGQEKWGCLKEPLPEEILQYFRR